MLIYLLYGALTILTICVIVLQTSGHYVVKKKIIQHAKLFKMAVTATMLATLVFIALVETKVRLNGGSHPDLFLFVHIALGTCFLVSLIAIAFKLKYINSLPTWLLSLNAAAFLGILASDIKLLSRL
jgi:hypothetical protein